MRLKLSIAALAACAAAALTAGSASASITYYPYGVGAPVLPVITNFSTDSLNTAPTHAPSGFSWAAGGTGVVFNTSNTAHSEPAVGPGAGHKPAGVHYLAVNTGQSETLDIWAGRKIDEVSLYVGSLDAFNKLTFDFVGGSSVSYTGAQLASLVSGAVANGNQLSSKSNGIFNFIFNKSVTSINFQSKGTSFEIADIWAKSVVPEPSEWVMLTLGVAMVGAVARRRRSFAGAAAIA